jgi:hypothetical protein
MLAVFEHINNALLEDVLETVLDESDFSVITFENQVTGVESVPDAAIRSSTEVWFETKTARDAVGRDQLEHHLKALEEDGANLRRLVVLTPDVEQPAEVAAIDDSRVVWSNFDSLVDALEAILRRDGVTTEEAVAIPTEREAFLLRELVRFVYDEGLVSGQEDRVLVVAARRAWLEYQKCGIYLCQPNRSFKPVDHMSFYADGEIKPAVPRVTDRVDEVVLTEEGIEQHSELNRAQKDELLEILPSIEERHDPETQIIFLEDDFELDQAIENNKTAEDTSRRIAFVQGHRYVSFSALREQPSYTSELER